MWLTQPREPTLAELFGSGSISGGGGISSALLQPRRNKWEEAVAKVLPVIAQAIQKKKSDQVANYLMNMQQPPRAEAIGYPQGAPPTMPFSGGADQFQVAELYRKQQEQAEERELKRRQIEAQINTKGESRVPIQIDGETYHVTPNAALEHFDRARRPKSKREDNDKWKESIVVARGKLDEQGEFTNQYTGAEQGEMVQLRTPSGETIIVPWSAYQEQTQNSSAAQVRPQIANTPKAQKDYPIGTKARKGNQWFVMTEGGWKPAVP